MVLMGIGNPFEHDIFHTVLCLPPPNGAHASGTNVIMLHGFQRGGLCKVWMQFDWFYHWRNSDGFTEVGFNMRIEVGHASSFWFTGFAKGVFQRHALK